MTNMTCSDAARYLTIIVDCLSDAARALDAVGANSHCCDNCRSFELSDEWSQTWHRGAFALALVDDVVSWLDNTRDCIAALATLVSAVDAVMVEPNATHNPDQSHALDAVRTAADAAKSALRQLQKGVNNARG